MSLEKLLQKETLNAKKPIYFEINKAELLKKSNFISSGTGSLTISSPEVETFKSNGQIINFSQAQGGSTNSEFTVSNQFKHSS